MKFLFSMLLSIPLLAWGTIFYVDPINGDINNDGSKDQPWSTLQDVFNHDLIETRVYDPLPFDYINSVLVTKNEGAPVKAGDTLLLMNGVHGSPSLTGASNVERITIMPAPGHHPVLLSFHLSAASNWNLYDLSISSEPSGSYINSTLLMVDSDDHHGPSSNVTIKGCTIYSAENTEQWSAEDWKSRISHGIIANGHSMNIQENTLNNVRDGILIGSASDVINNEISSFTGNGIIPKGLDIIVENNVIKNYVKAFDEESDGIHLSNNNSQDPLERIFIRNNKIINYENESQELRGSLRGITGKFGPYQDLFIENNLIIVDHKDGITLLDLHESTIVNNTVLDPTPSTQPGPAGINIDKEPSKRLYHGSKVDNNITNVYNLFSTPKNSLLLTNSDEYNTHFTDYQSFDFHLKEGSSAIDAANDDIAPDMDLDGIERPQGTKSDIGAYEYTSFLAVQDLKDKLLQTYPNPSSKELQIKLPQSFSSEALRIEIFSAQGILQRTFIKEMLRSDNTISISIEDLSAGIYVLKLPHMPGLKFIKKD